MPAAAVPADPWDHQATGTVHVGLARAVVAHVRQSGVAPEQLYASAWLDRLAGFDAATGLPLDEWHRLLDRAEARLGDPDLALGAAESVHAWHSGVLGLALMTSPSIACAGQLLVKLQRLFTNVYRLRSSLDERSFELQLLPATELRSPRLAGMLAATFATRTRWLTGREELRFDASLELPAPQDEQLAKRLFGGRVLYQQPVTWVRGSVGCLDLPVLLRDPGSHQVLCQQASAEVERLRADSAELLHRLRQRLHERLGKGESSLEALAADLELSPRTLQMRLESRGLSFRQVLDKVREATACTLLAEPATRLSDIAFALDFAGQSAFHHAFKRWTGLTPGQWRRQHAAARVRAR